MIYYANNICDIIMVIIIHDIIGTDEDPSLQIESFAR